MLTGVALALTLAFLLENPAQAGEASSDGGGEQGDPQRDGLRPGGAPAPPTRGAGTGADLEGSSGIVPVPSAPSAGFGDGGSRSLAARGGLAAGASLRPPWPITAGAPAAPTSGPGLQVANLPPLAPSGPRPAGAADRSATVPHAEGGSGPGASVAGSPCPLAESTGSGTAQQLGDHSPPIPFPQSLQIRIDRQESLVARSVEGPARIAFDGNQVGLEGSRLDLRQALRPMLSIDSLRRIEGLALSVLGSAELSQRSRNQAVLGSAIEGSAEGGSYRIRAEDALVLGLRAAQWGLVAVDDRVEGLTTSLLSADGAQGQTNLEIKADLKLSLGGGAGAGTLESSMNLTSTAVNGSTIRLGDGADTVHIASHIRRDDPPDPFGAAPAASAWHTVTVNSRAVGLANSELNTGGGSDLVTIEAGAREAVAMENSRVVLGGGDDHLLLEGTVFGSRIEPGEGSNQVEVSGAINDTVLVLHPGGDTSIRLSAADDNLVLEGEGGLSLQAGAGDDRIRVEGRAIGQLDGGAGQDTLEMARSEAAGWLDPAEPQQVELLGLNRGQIDGLTFHAVEAIHLADGGSHVVIDPLGSLDGPLQGSAGVDGLDYGAWTNGVSVDLGSGSATAISGGTAGGATGFEGVLGGLGADHLVAAADTHWLDGGAGDDVLEFNPIERAASDTTIRLTGSGGRDLFVLAGLDPLLLASPAAGESPGSPPGAAVSPPRLLPSLMDLSLLIGPGGDLQLSDRLAWRPAGILAAADRSAANGLVELMPSGLEGLGQSRRLPIAPLPALLAGIGTGPPQFAIATDPVASQLVLLGSSRLRVDLALLPGFHGLVSGDGTPLRS